MAGAFLAVSLLAAVSCDNFEDPQKSFIRNDSPEEDALYDLADGNVLFRWQAGGIQEAGYCFSLAADRFGDAAEKTEFYSTKFSYEANAVDLDRLLKSWGYLPRQTATVWWRVESLDGSVSDISAYRSINLTTLAMDAVDIVLDAPAEDALIAVNDVEQVTFSWEPVPNADIYSLEFSLTEDGEPIELSTDTDSYTSAEAVISADVFRLVYNEYTRNGSEVVLYWKVRSGAAEAPGASPARAVRLAGDPLPVQSFSARPGDHKAELAWTITDPRISKLKIEWKADGSGSGSKEIEVPAGSTDMKQVVENIAPGKWTFTVTSYGTDGNPLSETVSDDAEVYDLQSFTAGIAPRTAVLEALLREGVEISFAGEPDVNLSSCELLYTGADGSEKTVEVANDANGHSLADGEIKTGTKVTFRQHYSPAPEAIDDVVKDQELYIPAYSLVTLSGIKHWPNDDNTGALPNEMIDCSSLNGVPFAYSMLFDGNTTEQLNMWHTPGSNEKVSEENPIIATFDLGATYNLSSYVVWGRYGGTPDNPQTDGSGANISGYFAFGSYNPRAFKLYGSAEAPKNTADQTYWAVDGGWLDDWTLLADSEVIRPSSNTPTVSGQENWVPTAEDYEAAAAGFEFPVDMEASGVRYIRIVITETWNPAQQYRISFGELHFYQYTPEE